MYAMTLKYIRDVITIGVDAAWAMQLAFAAIIDWCENGYLWAVARRSEFDITCVVGPPSGQTVNRIRVQLRFQLLSDDLDSPLLPGRHVDRH